MRRVYLDHHAATPIDPRVRAALAELGEQGWANPSSVHAEGRRSRALIERAREQLAAALQVGPADLVLTSGGTEACNLALHGLLAGRAGAHVVTSAFEHPAVGEPLADLERRGLIRVTRLPVLAGRPPEPAVLAAALRADTALCALQWVNHELGTVFPIAAYAAACSRAQVPCFVDATQAFGKLHVAPPPGVTALALASHKVGGPAGAGALWVQRGVELASLLHGGGQERGRRAGTPDVQAAVGFGAACALVSERLAQMPRLAALRDRLEDALVADGAVRNGSEGPRVSTASNLWWPGRRADVLVGALDIEGLSVSAGSACSSGTSAPSPVVLAAYPQQPARAEASTRLSFGPEVTENDVDFAVACCRRVLARPAL